jgi:hypothetical protein
MQSSSFSATIFSNILWRIKSDYQALHKFENPESCTWTIDRMFQIPNCPWVNQDDKFVNLLKHSMKFCKISNKLSTT